MFRYRDDRVEKMYVAQSSMMHIKGLKEDQREVKDVQEIGATRGSSR